MNINTIKGNMQHYLYMRARESLITGRLPVINSLILEMDTHGSGSAQRCPTPPPVSLESPPSSHLLSFPCSECGCPTGNSSSSIGSATQYPPFKGIHCRLIGITWLEMLTLVFLNKVSINL